MSLQGLIDSFTTYRNRLVSIFNTTRGGEHEALFVTTGDGKFNIAPEPLVGVLVITNNAVDFEVCRAQIEDAAYVDSNIVVDAVGGRVYTFTQPNWTSTTTTYSNYVKPGRFYFNPILKIAYHCDLSGVVRVVEFNEVIDTLGTIWYPRASFVNQWISVAYGNGLFVAISTITPGVQLMYSSNGSDWNSVTVPQTNEWSSITYGNGQFVAVAGTGTNRVMTSPDGINWTLRTSPAGIWNSVAYGNGLFVAVGADAIMTSPDGIAWTSRPTPTAGTFTSVKFLNGRFLATNLDSNANIITSVNGTTWTTIAIPPNGYIYFTVDYGNGVYILAGSGLTAGSNKILTSTDLITWTPVTVPGVYDNGRTQWSCSVFANGKFVMLGVGAVAVSLDGNEWNISLTNDTHLWLGCTYADNKIVAVGSVDVIGGGSPDGIVFVSY